MYVNCSLAEVSVKIYKEKPTKGWNRPPYHTDVTHLPRYYIVRRHEIPCNHNCNLCAPINIWFDDEECKGDQEI